MSNLDEEMHESIFPGSIGCQPVLFGSLPKRNVAGKLPTTAGRLPALPRKAALKFPTPANERTAAQSEPPRIMRRARDPDSRIRHNIDSHICVANKAIPRVSAQIHFVVATCNTERLREFAWP